MSKITERQRQWLRPSKIEEYYLDIDLGFTSQIERDYQLYWAVIEGVVRAKHEGEILEGKSLYQLRTKRWSEDNMYALPPDIELSVEDVKKVFYKKTPNKKIGYAPVPYWLNEQVLTEHYSKEVQYVDYQRCITDGEIKIHQLAALACDLSPPGNTSGNSRYITDIRDSGTKIGLICGKLVHAVNREKIDVLHPGTAGAIEWKIISVSDAISWLEKEGIKISERLKGYVANHASKTKTPVGRGKPKGVGKIDDAIPLQKISAILKEGKVTAVKTACESVAAELEITEKNRPATVDRWRRKYRSQNGG